MPVAIYRHGLLISFSLLMSSCQLVDTAGPTTTWSNASAMLRDGNQNARTSSRGTALLGDTRPPPPTIIEGTGRFVGDPQPNAEEAVLRNESDGVTLNLVNVPAPQAAKAVLGDILSARYTVDPGIEGKITIQTPRPVPRSEVIDLFQAALRANGAAVINDKGMYRIVPIDQAAIGAGLQVGGKLVEDGKPGSGLRIVQLKYVAASEMRRVLEPIVPRGSIVRTDDARNLITLSGSDREIANTLDAISLFDVDVMKGMSFAIFPVSSSQPDAIVDELRNVFGSDREGPMAGMVRFLPNKRLKAILVISPQRTYLTRAGTWIRKLDARAEGSEKQFYTYSVQNRRAQELVDVVQAILSKETASSGSSASRNVSPQYREAKLQSSSSNSPPTSGFPSGGASPFGGSTTSGLPSSASASPTQSTSFGQSTAVSSASFPSSTPPANQDRPSQTGTDGGAEDPRMRIVADDAKNAILIEATRSDYRRIMRVIESLDALPTQVMIEATIAEITLSDELKFGLRWYLNNKNSNLTFSDLATGAVTSAFPGFSYALTAANITATLNALNSITDVNVISSPTLTAMDSKTAYLQIGDQVPITTQSASSVLTPGAPIVNSVTYKDTGVILSITPRINESGRVLLDIEQEVSTVDSTTTSTIDSPTIHQRRIKTSVVVNNGEGLALGGMIQNNRSISHTQIPIVGDIPVIGNAFKFKDNKIAKTELIVIITPHVMRTLSETRSVTDEFRKQLSIYSPRDFHDPRPIEQTARRTFE
ncbi:type II secretion system secretin GspD [Bradyrhizobium sp. INPA03-11B]|uniref:type II secretion system secretin GspD n=1 Tax=Bradyrhizobium sp. INPA03-11B TaxID=418598 RepID=UPI00338E2673